MSRTFTSLFSVRFSDGSGHQFSNVRKGQRFFTQILMWLGCRSIINVAGKKCCSGRYGSV